MSKKPIIIAEACQNHKGDQAILKDMVWAAAGAGADYIKIQSMLADELTRRDQFELGALDAQGNVVTIRRPYQPEYERLKPMDLDDNAHRWFIEECNRAKIKPLTTAFTPGRVKFLASLGWESIKVASYDCGSAPFIRYLKANFKHLFLSTGATFDEEISQAAEILADHSFGLLHCVTIYPTPLDKLNLRRIDWLRRLVPIVGFSDHSLVDRDGLTASFAALACGAEIIERHFTILPRTETKDGPVSINPGELKELVDFSQLNQAEQIRFVKERSKNFEAMLGNETQTLSEEELRNRDYYRGRFAIRDRDGKPVYNWENFLPHLPE